MIRRATIILALTLNPALVRAQDTALTISVPSADVHKGPSTVTPVIGHAARGAVLPVSRNLGSWVRVPWPEAPDGVGYVHVTMGRIGAASSARSDAPATDVRPGVALPARPAPAATPPLTRTPVTQPVAPRRSLNITPASHAFGIGGLIGSPKSYGASARAWRNNHLGIQVGFTRDAATSDITADRATSTQFEPGVVYALFDRVSDYMWVRPYVGSVVSFRQQTVRRADPVALDSVADRGVGFRIFGGSELMFASVPRLGLSADVGYNKAPTLFPGFEPDPLRVSIAGHWYIK
jgi:hypothetical protein